MEKAKRMNKRSTNRFVCSHNDNNYACKRFFSLNHRCPLHQSSICFESVQVMSVESSILAHSMPTVYMHSNKEEFLCVFSCFIFLFHRYWRASSKVSAHTIVLMFPFLVSSHNLFICFFST